MYQVRRLAFVGMLASSLFIGGSSCRNRDKTQPAAKVQPAPPTYPSTGIEADDSLQHAAPQKLRLVDQAAEHKKAVEVARAYLENKAGERIDAEFEVRSTEAGYRVFVQYVAGRDEQGQPFLVPGGHCCVVLSKGWDVVEVLSGA